MNRDEAEELALRIANSAGGILAGSKLKKFTLEATVHRHATGLSEDLGILSAYHSNPFIHYYMQLSIWFRGLKRTWQQS